MHACSRHLSLSKERDSFEDYIENGQVVFTEKVKPSVAAARNNF